jgi:hypothetical protein
VPVPPIEAEADREQGIGSYKAVPYPCVVKPKNKSTLWKITNLLPMQAGFGTQPSMDVSLIVGFTTFLQGC